MRYKSYFNLLWLAFFSNLGVTGLVHSYTQTECENLIPLTIMVGYNFETQCSITPNEDVYTFEITLVKPYFLEDEDFGKFLGACVGCIGEITNKSSWKTDFLYMNANGKRWRITTADCREAMRRTSGEAIEVGAYIINRLELIK